MRAFFFSIFFSILLASALPAEVLSSMKLNFDPAVEGGIPSLLLEPNPAAENPEGTVVRVTTYYLSEYEEQVTSTAELAPSETRRIFLPTRQQADILGVSAVAAGPDGTEEPLAAWRAWYDPDGKLVDYAGTDELPEPNDFDEFWAKAKADLAAIPMNPRIEPVPEKETATGKLYRVTLQSLGDVSIVCWYYVPKEVGIEAGTAAKTYPAVQVMPGWGAEEPPLDRTAEGFITLSLNPRAHGPSKEFFDTDVPHHLWNIDNADEYYYRAAYMDCVRGIDFLASRPEVDPARIATEGGSQGGAFSLATAALDKRIACAAANVPYICNFADYARLATRGSGLEFGRYMRDPDTGVQVRRTLALIDGSHMARRITCPVNICVGLQDRVCPPILGVVAHNRLPKSTPKRLYMDPKADHEVPPTMRAANQTLYAEFLGAP